MKSQTRLSRKWPDTSLISLKISRPRRNRINTPFLDAMAGDKLTAGIDGLGEFRAAAFACVNTAWMEGA